MSEIILDFRGQRNYLSLVKIKEDVTEEEKKSLKGQLELWVAEKKSKEGIPEEGMTCTRKRCVHGAIGRPVGQG